MKMLIVVSLLSLACAVPAMAVEITGLVYSEDLVGEYGIWKPMMNQFVHGDRCVVIVPFRGATVIEEPERKIGLETFITLMASDGTKIYDHWGTGLYELPTPTFDPDRATFYVELTIQTWMPAGEYTIEITVCDYLNNTVDSIQSTFYIRTLPKGC